MIKYTEQYKKDLQLCAGSIPCLEELSRAKILVTGAGGLIGSAIVDLLLSINDGSGAGITVYAAGRNLSKLENRYGALLPRNDLVFLNYDSAKVPEWDISFSYIIHTASPAFPAAFATVPVETMIANFTAMQNLLEYARTYGVKRVLYISSSEVYGKKEGTEPYREQEYGFVDILNPRACYPSSKRAAETLCAAYMAEYDVDSVIVRPGHVYGPTATSSDNRAATAFCRDALDGKDIVMKSEGLQLRSYCYVLDCASAIITVLLRGKTGKAYNISNKDSVVTIRRLAESIAQCAGRSLIFSIPTETERKSYNMMDNSSLDSSSLEDLGWRGLFDIDTGIKHTLEAME